MTMSTNLGWTKIRTGAQYAGVGVRTFRAWLKQGLKYVRLPSGTILIKWIDEFLEYCLIDSESDKIDRIVQEIIDG